MKSDSPRVNQTSYRTRVAEPLEVVEPALDPAPVALGLEPPEPLQLAPLRLGIDAEDVDVVDGVGHVLVDADDDVLTGPVALVVGGRRLLDLALDELERLDRAAELVDLADQLPGRFSISSVSDSMK